MKKIICFILIALFLLNSTAAAFAGGSVTLDEATFNQLVTRAQQADVLEEEKDFYKSKYEQVVSRSLELSSLYTENLTVKDQIIETQKELVATNLERIKIKDDVISAQDKQISKLERRNTLKNLLILGVTAGGIAVASNNGDSGAAVGIGAAGLLTFVLK